MFRKVSEANHVQFHFRIILLETSQRYSFFLLSELVVSESCNQKLRLAYEILFYITNVLMYVYTYTNYIFIYDHDQIVRRLVLYITLYCF